MASAGNGSAPHIFGALFMFMAGVNMVHAPYRGSYFPDLLGGQVQVLFGPVPSSIGYIQAGKLAGAGGHDRGAMAGVAGPAECGRIPAGL